MALTCILEQGSQDLHCREVVGLLCCKECSIHCGGGGIEGEEEAYDGEGEEDLQEPQVTHAYTWSHILTQGQAMYASTVAKY
jgi:hypothetical protein